MANNLNLNETVNAWAEIVVRIWEEQIKELDAIYSWQLIDSLAHHVNTQSEGNPDRIDFFYKWYGKMVDMGVGGNVDLGNQEAMIAAELTDRRPKPWFSSNFHSQAEKLSKILAQKYSQKSALVIVKNVTDNADMHTKRWETI